MRATMSSGKFMEIPIDMIVACRLLPFRPNRLANIIAGSIVTLINGGLTFIPPLVGARTPPLPAYLFFATTGTVATSLIVRQTWNWSVTAASIESGILNASPVPNSPIGSQSPVLSLVYDVTRGSAQLPKTTRVTRRITLPVVIAAC